MFPPPTELCLTGPLVGYQQPRRDSPPSIPIALIGGGVMISFGDGSRAFLKASGSQPAAFFDPPWDIFSPHHLNHIFSKGPMGVIQPFLRTSVFCFEPSGKCPPPQLAWEGAKLQRWSGGISALFPLGISSSGNEKRGQRGPPPSPPLADPRRTLAEGLPDILNPCKPQRSWVGPLAAPLP